MCVSYMFMNAHVNICIMGQADAHCIRMEWEQEMHSHVPRPQVKWLRRPPTAMPFGATHGPLPAKRQSRLSNGTAEWKQSEQGWLLKVIGKLFKHPVIMV